MDMKEEQYLLLIYKYHLKTISDSDQITLQNWLKEKPEHQVILEETKKVLDFSKEFGKDYRPDPRLGFKMFKSAISLERNHSVKSINLSFIARLAAVIVLAATLILIFYSQSQQGIEIAELETYVGEKTEVTLPDGSRIWLNQSSKISYSMEYPERQVQLEGEAYFEVAKHGGQPFIIYSGNAKTEVLGTSFNIKNYDSDEKIEVIVVTGRVAFSAGNNANKKKVVLDPGSKAVLVKEQNKIIESINDDPNFLSWKTNELLFDNSPLEKVLNTLENHYGISFQVKDNGAMICPFTGTFKDASIEEIIRVLSYSMDINFLKHPGFYLLQGPGCD